MAVERNIKTVVEETSNIKGYKGWISKHKYKNRVNCLENVFISLPKIFEIHEINLFQIIYV